jgi:hypothetical protein
MIKTPDGFFRSGENAPMTKKAASDSLVSLAAQGE